MDKRRSVENPDTYRQFITDLALALDGDVSADDDEAESAYNAALLVDRLVLLPAINRLRNLGEDRIAVAAHRYDDLTRLLQVIDVPFRLLADGESLGAATLALLGCGVNERFGSSVAEEARDSVAVLVTSDRSAYLAPVARVLYPQSPSAPRTARARWNRVSDDESVEWNDAASRHYAVSLSPGHVPVAPNSAGKRVLVTDGFTGDPLVVLIREGEFQLLHAVPHWWQSAPIVDTAVDRRLIRDIPAYEGLGLRFPELTFGRFSAARLMLSAFLIGLGMALSHRSDTGEH